jgi:hypothetical protein
LFTRVRLQVALAAALLLGPLCTAPAQAIPIFAQRYHLSCKACHTAIPELNAFGNSFREHGYQLAGVTKHGTTVAAVRFQFEWQQSPGPADRRFEPAGVILLDQDAGKINAFLHYSLGALGGPGGVFLGYLTRYDAHTKSLYRAGLFELPMNHSPGERLDDLASYGFDQTHVGLNDLTLAAPRYGLDAERQVGMTRLMATFSGGEYQGSAYGGKPVATGEVTSPTQPEVGFFTRTRALSWLDIDTDALLGERKIRVSGTTPFLDAYRRYGFGAHAQVGRIDILAQQWYGLDHDADGAGDEIGSSGGFTRLKYYVTPHAYFGARYDTAASPEALRDWVFYVATAVTPHARVLLERRSVFGTPGETWEGALTLGFPWPAGL